MPALWRQEGLRVPARRRKRQRLGESTVPVGRLRAARPEAAGQRIEIALAIIDELDRQLAPLESQLGALVRRQPGCQALMRFYGIGPLTATTILCELGDVRRLSASRKAVRCAGLDIGVHRSDRRSRAGKLTRQGSPQLRWALYEAAQSSPADRPINHHVVGHTAAHPDKPGRPRNDRTTPTPRNHSPPLTPTAIQISSTVAP